MCKRIITIILALAAVCGTWAQETFTLRGKVYDFKTRTELPGATVQLMRTDSTVVTTTTAIEHWQDGDRKGETSDFMLTVPKKEATYIIRCSFLGYKTTDMTVTLGNLKKREFMRELPPILMREDSKLLHEVTRELQFIRQLNMGGAAYFRAQFLLDNVKGLETWVRNHYYTSPALLPPLKNDRTYSTTQSRTPRFVLYASDKYPVDTENPENIVRVFWGKVEYNKVMARLFGMHMAVTRLDDYGNESEPMEITDL